MGVVRLLLVYLARILKSRRPLLATLSLLLPAALVLFAACTDQAEGERCDTRADRNGSDDCQPGLECVAAGELGSGSSAFCEGVTTCGVCCPEDRALATTDVCRLSTDLPGADAAVPADAATGGPIPVDASGDDAASTSTSSDASDASTPDAGGDDAGDAAASDASDASDDADG